MSETPFKEPVRLRAMWLRVWVASIFLASFYSALGHFIDFIFPTAFLLVCVLLLLPMMYSGTANRVLVRLLIAIIGAALGTFTLWAVWYGLEFSWATLVDAAKLSPQQPLAQIIALSDQFTYSVELSYGTTDHGTGLTKLIWATETALFAVTPLIGALIGPRMMQAFQRYVAKSEAKRARR